MGGKKSPRSMRVCRRYDSPYPASIPFRAGETVTVGEEYREDPQWKGWVRCYGSPPKEAWAPRQFLAISGSRGVFKREYDARELSVVPGDTVLVHETVNGFARVTREQDREVGWVPLRCLSESQSGQAKPSG